MASLSLPLSIPQSSENNEQKSLMAFPSTQIPRLFSGAGQPKATCPTAGGGEHHENVPGK
jgi:hypothetical protein